MRRRPACALLTAALVTSTALVSARQFPAPPGWKWVTDGDVRLVTTTSPPDGAWLFGTMPPGWHVTTRPGAIMFEPTHAGRGRFSLESESFLFPGDSNAGFGVFVGGATLESAPRYVAFLIRRDGSAAIEAVDRGEKKALHPWTTAAAVAPGRADANVRNVLRVDAEAAAVTFLVNGQNVAVIPRDADRFDGIVGLRVGENLNLHVTNLDLTHRLALPRRAKQP